ncbi:MAG: periplasmic heavy metal sensor [Sandaracinaceae bacterium]|nr:periplasmic heavy metal sensor [Sandaracinaceae bacterium]
MIGFFIGFLCLALLIAVLRGGRRGCGRGWHGGGGRGEGWHGGHRHRGRGGAGWLGFVFDRLETTPAQEREIRAALDTLLEKRGELRREGEASRRDLARLMRTETLDETILGEAFARHDERLRELQKAFADALGKVHQALDPAQRERLAAFLERERDGWGGPYRGWI